MLPFRQKKGAVKELLDVTSLDIDCRKLMGRHHTTDKDITENPPLHPIVTPIHTHAGVKPSKLPVTWAETVEQFHQFLQYIM